jgi:Response regulators consisting of a CheY-like receiver domain and a winged-helix DNA-binding domain
MTNTRKILIVDDEQNILDVVTAYLEKEGYETITAIDGEAALKIIEKETIHLVVLDLMLPKISGEEVCHRIRAHSDIPIIMLTAKSEEFDKVLGLELGADDYITKPFSVRELVARVKAIFRRIGNNTTSDVENIRHGDITIDCTRHEVYKGGKLLEMPLKEFELLKMLIINKGKVLSRELLLDKIWGFDYYGETRTVDVHIRYLRQKIEDDDSNPIYIETIRGIGYRFNDKEISTDGIQR